MSRPALVVHGHFYQPPRLDPFTGTMPRDPTAAPAHDWNERISADCYRPNAEHGNLAAISWDVGPTLAGWLAETDRVAYRGFVDGDGGRNGMAQPFHHTIMPLASAADRRTEVRWGLRDFELRFGRRPTGMWLPETAVDRATLRLLVDEGIAYTILAPWQVEGGPELDTRTPVRLDLGDGRSIIAVLYDGLLSAAVSFEPGATTDATSSSGIGCCHGSSRGRGTASRGRWSSSPPTGSCTDTTNRGETASWLASSDARPPPTVRSPRRPWSKPSGGPSRPGYRRRRCAATRRGAAITASPDGRRPATA